MARQAAPELVEPDEDAVDEVAGTLVAAGRVVPGLSVGDDGRARSWWWPLPAAAHRSLIAGLVTDPTVAGQRQAATRLAKAVAATVRRRLADEKLVLAPKRWGRPLVAEA